MKATIVNVSKNGNDFQHPQIDVEVEYSDKRFPDGKRTFVFTLPPDKFKGIEAGELESIIIAQGKAFEETLKNSEEMVSRENVLKDLIGQEFNI